MKEQSDKPMIPPVEGDVHPREFMPFHYSTANWFTNPYWYAVTAACIGLMCFSLFLAWFKPLLEENIADAETRANLFMCGTLIYFALCIALPVLAVRYVLKLKRKKNHG